MTRIRGLLACASIAVVTACGSSHSSAVATGGGSGAGGTGTGGTGTGGSAGSCDPIFYVSCNGACLLQPGDEGGGCTLLGTDTAHGMAVSSGFLYYSGATSIDRLDLTSLDVLKLVEVPALPKDVAVDSSAVYFDTEASEPAVSANFYDGTIRSVAPTGGGFTLLAQGLGTPLVLRLIGTELYFGVGSTDFFSVMTESVTATSATKVQVGDVSAFAVDGDTVFFAPALADSSYATDLSSALFTDPFTRTVLAPLPVDVTWLSVDATYVYFVGVSTDASGTVLQTSYGRVAKADGTVETLRTSSTPFIVKVAEADFVYILERADTGNRVIKMPLGGGAEQTLATFHDTYNVPLAVDSTSVYIGSEKGIVRVAK